jgi:hypothetical protein
VRAVASKAAGALPVCCAAYAVPGLVRHAMDTGDLIIRRRDIRALALEVLETQDQQVVLVREVTLKVTQLPAEGNSSYPGDVLVEGLCNRGTGTA